MNSQMLQRVHKTVAKGEKVLLSDATLNDDGGGGGVNSHCSDIKIQEKHITR